MDEHRQEHLSVADVDTLNNEAFVLKTIDPFRAVTLTEEAEQLAGKLGYQAGGGMAIAIRAYALVQLDDSVGAHEQGVAALAICENLNLYRGCGCALFGIAAGLMDAGDLDDALEKVYRTLDMFERSRDRDAVANALLLLSIAYAMLNDVDHAEKYALHALTLYRELGNRGGEWLQLNNLAYQYLMWGDATTAKRYGMEALAIHQQLQAAGLPYHFQYGASSFYHTLAEIALTENNVDQAEAYLIEGLNLVSRDTVDTLSLQQYYLLFALGRVLHRRGSYTAARSVLVATLKRVTRHGFRPLVAEIQQELSHLYNSLGQPQRALHYYRRFHHNDKARYYEQLASKMRRLELKYVMETARRETELLSEKNRQLELAYTELQIAHKQIRELSIRDGLTGLHNRRYFEDAATRLFDDCLQRAQPFALLLVDIDDFKRVNDTFLHHIGDQVLITVGRLLRDYQVSHSITARIGGEEFVMALPNTSLDNAMRIGEALRQEIYTYPWDTIHPDLKVSMSIGVAGQEHCATLSQQMIQADRHLYLAKHGGKNQVSVGRFVIVK